MLGIPLELAVSPETFSLAGGDKRARVRLSQESTTGSFSKVWGSKVRKGNWGRNEAEQRRPGQAVRQSDEALERLTEA